MALQGRAVGRPTPYLPRARTMPLVAYVPVFLHMYVAVSFAGNVCGGNNGMALLGKNAWGWWIQTRGTWTMNTIHSVGTLALSFLLSMRPLCVASLELNAVYFACYPRLKAF
jgi:hypothetical protein